MYHQTDQIGGDWYSQPENIQWNQEWKPDDHALCRVKKKISMGILRSLILNNRDNKMQRRNMIYTEEKELQEMRHLEKFENTEE